MNSFFVLLLCIPAVLSTTFQYPNDDPNLYCNCVPLEQCSTVFSRLKSSHAKDGILHKAFTKYLSIINCGYYRREPYICCPNEIPREVVEIVENKKYWTKSQEKISIKKLRCASENAKNSLWPDEPSVREFESAENLEVKQNVPYQFPGCGVYSWREDFFGNATYIGEYPWLALLEYDTPQDGKQFLCGGALISDQHILTAAHCLTSRSNTLTNVILGEHDTSNDQECTSDGGSNPPFCVDSVQKYEVEYSVVHEDYNDGISHRDPLKDGIDVPLHDIALIKLKNKVQLTPYVQPICLPLKKPITKRFQIAGWGRSFVPENKGLNLKLMTRLSECMRFEYERREIEQLFDKNEHICAVGRLRNEQSCIVDSGGPLMADERKEDGTGRMTVFGISYMENTCANLSGKSPNLPGIFTNVYNYKDWILHYMNA